MNIVTFCLVPSTSKVIEVEVEKTADCVCDNSVYIDVYISDEDNKKYNFIMNEEDLKKRNNILQVVRITWYDNSSHTLISDKIFKELDLAVLDGYLKNND